MKRRDFLRASAAAPLLAALPQELRAHDRPHAPAGTWDGGALRHLLPTVSDTQILIKASFAEPLKTAPTLRVSSSQRVTGQMSDTNGEFWQFHATGLEPGRTYTLRISSGDGKPLSPPWPLATFPAPDAKPEKLRILFYTCAGGHEGFEYLPTATRNRLLRRGLSFHPDAAVANGDHVYWDLRSPLTSKRTGGSAKAREIIRGTFDRKSAVLDTDNETLLKRAAGPQIAPVYGTDFRSTPTFFIQDDHDYYDNDDAYDEIVTFPPDAFMTQMARATQALWYPEFLPDNTRPVGLAGASAGGRAQAVAESFGTLRYGRMAEVLLYTVRRGMTLAGPSAVFLDDITEDWLKARMAAQDTAHVVNAPSNPPGWTAGKWGEWYPDVLGKDGKLTVDVKKPYWQDGWLKQHDRLMAAMSGMKGRVPLSMSGDLHAIGIGRIQRTGNLDLSANPVVSVLTGPVGTWPGGWPSGIRKIGAQPPLHLKVDEEVKPIENHGFTLADFTQDKIVLRFFKWDRNTQGVDAIDTLEPFHTAELKRPG